jgi:hypothetical protein
MKAYKKLRKKAGNPAPKKKNNYPLEEKKKIKEGRAYALPSLIL